MDPIQSLISGADPVRREPAGPDAEAALRQALKTIQEAFERHPCTQRLAPEVLADWKAWAAEHARAFQRASSADKTSPQQAAGYH